MNKDEYVNMIEAEIIDPTKVTRSALQNTASITVLLLTTAHFFTDIPSKESLNPSGTYSGGMLGMD